MKPHKIVKSFKGSQHGNDNEFFVVDTERDLSDDLARIVVKEGWALPLIPAEHRDTKVFTPAENKVEAPIEKKKRK
jgi:hypothetical protein